MRLIQLLALSPSLLLALPQGHRVAHGSADLKQTEHRLTITASDKAILEWTDFSIEENETACFVLPSSQSSLLNRVLEACPSRLLGKLEANGRVLLINPHGVLVGANAQIDTGAFIASSLDILDSAFLNSSELSFAGDSKSPVIHLGSIHATAGEAFLIGPNVECCGFVHAAGDAGAIAGSSALLKSESLSLGYSYASHRSEALASALVAGAINGKRVLVFGDTITLSDQAKIDASGDFGGGSILIGGDYQGKNRDIQNAAEVWTSQKASIHASSRISGDGGRVVVWGDLENFFYGNISAEGGMEAGDGGFVEISSPLNLEFQGTVSTRSSHGERGTLLLDPSQITIGPAGAPQAVNGGCGFPANTFALNAAAGNLSTATLLAALVGNNVTVTTQDGTCGPFAGTGNIIVSGALAIPLGSGNLTLTGENVRVDAAINYAAGSANSFTINATDGINIYEDIQIPGTGNVTLNETGGGDVNIGDTLLGALDVSVGSQNGLTQLCAPNSAVTIRARNVGPGSSQLGFFTPALGQSTGPIEVSCDTLDLTGGGANTGVLIGHGQGRGNVDTSTTATATINVYAENDITLQGTDVAGGNQGRVWIGHGSRQFPGAANCDQAGDITVISRNGNIILTQGNDPIVSVSLARIGHGGSAGTAVLALPSNISGSITVQACNGQIDLLSQFSNNSNICMIGHGHPTRYNGNVFNTLIDVACRNNLTLDGSAPNSQTVIIGCASGNGTILNLTQNMRVTAGGQLSMSSTQNATIGTNFNIATLLETYTGDIEVAAGSINISGTGCLIGVTVGPQMGYNLLNGNTSVLSLSNLTMNVNTGVNNFSTIEHGGNVSVAAIGDMQLTAGAGSVIIGTSNRSPAGFATTRIYAGGSIFSSVLNPTRDVILGFEGSDLLNTNGGGYNIDIRAGGDIQMTRGIVGLAISSTLAGSIFIQADSPFPPGSIWSAATQNNPRICALTSPPTNFCQLPLNIPLVAGPAVTAICGVPLSLPLTEAFLLPIGGNLNSGNIAANGSGAFSVVHFNPPNITFQTTSGNITVNSACSTVGGAAQSLSIGTVLGTDTLQVITDSGNITISGSVCGDAFHDVSIRSVANAWTSGSIEVRACDNINVLDDVVTDGLNSTITMVADNNLNGTGNLTIGNGEIIQTINGSIALSAGLKDASCQPPSICTRFNSRTANIIHNSNCLVTSTNGSILETASGSIQINNATVTTANGAIQMLAGVDININSTVGGALVTGPITLIAGRDIHLLSATSLVSSLNSVTLVCDNDFPSCPFNPFRSPIGKVTTVAGSQIIGDPLFIFTALQSENSLLGTLNGASFTASPDLYTDTSSEVWCTVFSCPGFSNCAGSAFPIGLGDPYTLFYKDCLQIATRQATVIVDQFLVDLHPFNEFPGWIQEFFFTYEDMPLMNFKDPFYLRRRELHAVNHPKSWTAWLNQARFNK